jgi:type I restriction enzyme R subunit
VGNYIGIANELKQALKEYTASNGRGRHTVDAHESELWHNGVAGA